MIKESTVVRDLNTYKYMSNKYYKVLECLNVDDMIKDAVVCPFLTEDLLEEDCLADYSENNLPYYMNIVEAFGTTWVFINSYGDAVDQVHINKDGSVYGSSQECISPELGAGMYYAGDEVSFMGALKAFETDEGWLWNSVERNCKTKSLRMSLETLENFIEERKDYLIAQARSEKWIK